MRARVAKLAAAAVYVATLLLAFLLPSHLCHSYSTFGPLLQTGQCIDVGPMASLPENSRLIDPHIDRRIGLRFAIVGLGALVAIVILVLGLPPKGRDEERNPPGGDPQSDQP